MTFATTALLAAEAHRDLPAPIWIYPLVAAVLFILMLGFTFTHRHVGDRRQVQAEKEAQAMNSVTPGDTTAGQITGH